jgi:hypothetical protein
VYVSVCGVCMCVCGGVYECVWCECECAYVLGVCVCVCVSVCVNSIIDERIFRKIDVRFN